MRVFFCLLPLAFLSGCYSFRGISIPENVERAYIPLFEDNATTGPPPTLALEITERLRDKVRDEARLLITDERPDIEISGTLVDFRVTAEGAQSGDDAGLAAYAAENHLRITVAIEYKNLADPDGEGNWRQNFSDFFPFPATSSLASIQDEGIEYILEQINEKIFNKAFAEEW